MTEFSKAYLAAFGLTVNAEGKTLDLTYSDRGNWTTGIVGQGLLKGSKFGVSAYAYPKVDIANLTIEDAQLLFKEDRWDPNSSDELPIILALTLFDSAVNNGTREAAMWLQQVLGVRADGDIGPITKGVIEKWDPVKLSKAFHQKRAHEMIHFGTWSTFEDGWEDRLSGLPFDFMATAYQLQTGA